MNTLEFAFKDYASSHRTPGNKLCHMFGIPMIVLTVLGLLGKLPIAGGLTNSELVRLDGGTLAWAIAMVWYVKSDWKLGLPFGLVTFGMYLIGRAIPSPGLWALFALAWAVQFIGHGVYEKRSPAFFRSLTHLLVGPYWIFAKMVNYRT